jgi:two-component system OmpR family sensor kinase
MITRQNSLLRTLLKSLLLPGSVAVILGIFIVYILVKEEYDELQDIGLTSKANLLLNILEVSLVTGGSGDGSDLSALLAFEEVGLKPEERTVFWFLDTGKQVIAQSPGADLRLLPVDIEDGLSTAQGHRIAILTSRVGQRSTVVVATPMTERNEAITDVLFGAIIGFVMLGGLFAGAAFWTVRRSVAVIADLSDNIADRNEHNLSPIDRRNSFTEIGPAIDTLDKLMARLAAILIAERAFATNAAHELRTPVAICLANVQRLKSILKDPRQLSNAAEIELGLKRLNRLIERLLQMSRAQSGLGTKADETDITPVIAMMLKELRDREPSQDRLVVKDPTGVWLSRVDPDAMGIILSNLFDNALKYSSGVKPTLVDASQPGRIVISNDCDALEPADLEAIQGRFIRKAPKSDGFGLGLSIVQDLCSQSGCTLDVISPQVGSQRGFTAIVTIPLNS